MEEKSISQIYNESMKEITQTLIDKTDDTTEARNLIEDLITKISTSYDLSKDYHTFENQIERILYMNDLNIIEKGEYADIPLHYIYYFLGLAYLDDGIYEDAIINFSRTIKMNPYFAKAIFKISECYRVTNELDKMYSFLLSNHKFIYEASELSDFYSQLGDYFYDIKNYSFANTLYSYSEYYKSTGYNQKQLTNISRFEGRTVKVDSVEEIIGFLKERGIPISISHDILNRLINIYRVPADNNSKVVIKLAVKKILYDLTKNEIFAPSSYLRNDEIGFIFQIPETWEVLSRTSYNKSGTSSDTLFVIKPLSRVTINITNLGKIGTKGLKEKYLEIKNNYIKDGYLVSMESIVKAGSINYVQSFIIKKVLNDSVIDVHNYVIINNYLIDFMVPINQISSDNDILLTDKNVIRINNLLSTLQIIGASSEEKEEFTF